jgi:hypothetical protein
MMSHSHESVARPPRMAAGLVHLFAPGDQAETILGDLLEEFSDVTGKAGAGAARRWYWRQTAKTIPHVIAGGFCTAPWSLTAIVLSGFLLAGFTSGFAEQTIVGVLHLLRHHVTPFYNDAQMARYLFLLNNSVLVARLLMSLIIGSLVAIAAKGREMLATISLALVCALILGAQILVSLAMYYPPEHFLLPFLIQQFGNCSLFIMGGVIVRESRSALSRRPSRT